MPFVCAKCTLDGLGTAVAAELSCHIDRFVRKYLEDLRSSSVRGRTKYRCVGLLQVQYLRCGDLVSRPSSQLRSGHNPAAFTDGEETKERVLVYWLTYSSLHVESTSASLQFGHVCIILIV